MIYPSKLTDGDLIEIVSPSNGITKKSKIEKLDNACKFLNENGFLVKEDANVRKSSNGVSAPAKSRAEQINKAITDPDVKALIACGGGDYLIQILNLIDFKKLKNNIKWIQGQSDITNLLYYVTTKYDIATIYSFNVKTFGNKNIPKEMLENNIQVFKKNKIIQKEYGYIIDDENNKSSWECITNYRPIKGRIIGGCLDSLKDLIGTKYDSTKKFINKYKNEGIVWYFDVAEMTNEDILRTMWQLKELNWFKYARGIIFGRLYEEVTYTNTSLKEAINYFLEELNIPIIINADIGHTDPNITIVNGSIVEITKKDKFEIRMEYQ